MLLGHILLHLLSFTSTLLISLVIVLHRLYPLY